MERLHHIELQDTEMAVREGFPDLESKKIVGSLV